MPGAVTAQPDGRVTLTRALARENSAGGGTAVAVDSLPDRIVTALADDGAEVYRPELGSLVAAVPADPQARNEARQAVADVDDEAVRLKSAVKSWTASSPPTSSAPTPATSPAGAPAAA